jgi:glycosyltransferase involved in cell wall biosynthesis
MRVLVVTNFVPDAGAPQRGRWVLDQVEEVRRLGVEVDVFSFPPGSGHYIPAAVRLRRLLRRDSFDLVHVHYGLTAWSALLAGARPLVVTFHGTDVRHPIVGPLSRRLAWRADLVAAVSRSLFGPEDDRPCPAGRTSAASTRCRRPRHGSGSGSIPTAATCSSPPTRIAPRSEPTVPSRWPQPAKRSC